MRKPNSNAVLKTLADERQATIAQYARDHSLEETVAWLHGDGLETSTGALSNFLSWYSLQQQLARNAATVETLLADYVKDNPAVPPEKIQAMGQAFFSAMSLAQQDPETWVQVQRLNIQRSTLALDERRIALLEKKAAAFDQIKNAAKSKGGLTKETIAKIERELNLL